MNSPCASGKQSYDSLNQAREGLIQVRAKAGFRKGEGPEGIYHCELCSCYHLTSGQNADYNLNEEDYARIEREAENRYWETKYRGKNRH